MCRHSFSFFNFVLVIFVLSFTSACDTLEPGPVADLVLRGGKVVTVDTLLPEAEAIAVKGDTIIAVGSDEDIAAFIGSNTQIVELDGNLAIPGLIEGHGHFMGIGRAKMILDLMSVTSWEEIVAMIDTVSLTVNPASRNIWCRCSLSAPISS